MLIGETVMVALQSIRANAMRSILTALGIIIGVAAVITVVALGAGAQKAVEVVVYRLRKKLVDTGVTLMTLRGLGYLLKVAA